MLPIQSIEGPPHASTADENGESRQQKPKTLPCKYCSKRFRRVEHVQRHERTHTKEKPFSCAWDRCGKTFGRRDLLVRHEKLVHLNEGNKDGNRPRKPSAGTVQPGPADGHVDPELLGMPRGPPPSHFHPGSLNSSAVPALAPDPRERAAACNLDLLSDAATRIASATEVNAMQPALSGLGQPPGELARIKAYEETMQYGDRPRDPEQAALSAGFGGLGGPAPFDDYNVFLDESFSTHLLPSSLEAEQPLGLWSRHHQSDLQQQRGGPSKSSSRFPSRFPSLQPDPRDQADGAARLQDESMRAPPLRISVQDHSVIKSRLDEFSSVLPNDFVFPSRYTLTRFLEGYVSGFHEYLPFLHIPTLSPTDLCPELLLAILAVGAQYRFESHRGHALWYAAKAVALEQIRRRHSHEVHGLLPTPQAYSPHSTRPSPSSGFRHTFPNSQQERPTTQDTHREPYSPNTPQSRLETIQALLLLFAVGLWGAKAILHEALSLQSQLALLVREEGLVSESSAHAVDWETWIRVEGSTRTKLIAYCFFNLCSIAYNMPPMLLTSEINLLLPQSSKQWRAETSWQWQEARHSYQQIEMSLQDAFARLFSRQPQAPATPLSSLGNYVLIHALIQHIFLLKQTSFAPGPSFHAQRGLKLEDVEDISHALRVWQAAFEHYQQAQAADAGQQMMGDGFSGGPVAFNSTALLRLAYIRLYTDLIPTRTLETRDAILISSAFNDAPLLVRNVRLQRALLQAIHALSVLVKVGVNYIARTKSLEWSIQHSLCNLECAILLSKWLVTLASIGPTDHPPSPEEKNLLEIVRRMLDETEFAVPIDPSLSGPSIGHASVVDLAASDSTRIRQLAAAVIRLWAETFKGAHIFEIIKVIGNGLEGYADLLEKPRDRTPLGRMAPLAGLG